MPALPIHSLGRNGPKVPAMGYGAMGIAGTYGPAYPDADRFAILDRCLELGCTFWDTADAYYDSEQMIGNWFKRTGKRDSIFLASKFGLGFTPEGTLITRSDPAYAKEACEKSLKTLGVACIDLYYCHRVDKTTPIEETIKAMVELKEAGKIKYLGLSEISAATLRRAYAVYPISAVQIEYSPFDLEIESPDIGLLQACRELGVAIVGYSPLGRGMLTGQYRSPADFEKSDFRTFLPRFSEENFPKNLVLVDQLKAMADKKGCTTSQLVLAWEMAQGDDFFPIPGTRQLKYLEENLGAANVKLSKEEVADIRKFCEAAEMHGERVAAMLADVYSDTPELKR